MEERSNKGSSSATMRVITQIGILAVIAGAGIAWHLYGEQAGLPRPLALLGLEKEAGPATPGRPAAGAGLAVVAAPVRMGAVVERVESVGSARARDAITLTSRVSGIVSAIRFEEGQRVKAGDVLV
nr:biotin/lipoyl-binding protein [Acetobacteraceae bacterium]